MVEAPHTRPRQAGIPSGGAAPADAEPRFLPLLDAELPMPDGRVLGYAVWGDPQGWPVLLFHGTPASRLFCPDPTVAAAAGARVVTVDRPGYGRSSTVPDRRVLDWPADVQRLVDALAIERFAVIAHSSGAPYALACAVRMPARVTRVALVSGVVPLDQCPPARASLADDDRQLVELARRDPAEAAAAVAQAAAWLADDPDRFLTFPRPAPDALLLEDPAIRAMFRDAVRESVRTGLDGYAWDEVLERQPWGFGLEEVRVDVRVWHGGQDGSIPRSHVEAAAERLPRCRVDVDPAQGHGLIVARWAEILDSVAEPVGSDGRP